MSGDGYEPPALKAVRKMEGAVLLLTDCHLDVVAQVSIAISLKRIADALTFLAESEFEHQKAGTHDR